MPSIEPIEHPLTKVDLASLAQDPQADINAVLLTNARNARYRRDHSPDSSVSATTMIPLTAKRKYDDGDEPPPLVMDDSDSEDEETIRGTYWQRTKRPRTILPVTKRTKRNSIPSNDDHRYPTCIHQIPTILSRRDDEDQDQAPTFDDLAPVEEGDGYEIQPSLRSSSNTILIAPSPFRAPDTGTLPVTILPSHERDAQTSALSIGHLSSADTMRSSLGGLDQHLRLFTIGRGVDPNDSDHSEQMSELAQSYRSDAGGHFSAIGSAIKTET